MADLIDRDELKKRYIATAQSGGYLGDVMSIATNHLTRLLRLIDEAPAVEPMKGEWISVEDALPTDNTLYLVKLDSRGGKLRHAAVDTDRISIHGGWVRWQGYVTHWMPFPIWLL